MTHDTPQVLYISADTSGQTTRYIASPEMHTGAEAWVPKDTLDALRDAAKALNGAASELLSVLQESGAFDSLIADLFPESERRGTTAREAFKSLDAARNNLRAWRSVTNAALAALPAPPEGAQGEGG